MLLRGQLIYLHCYELLCKYAIWILAFLFEMQMLHPPAGLYVGIPVCIHGLLLAVGYRAIKGS